MVRIAYNGDMAKEAAKKAIRKDLEDKGMNLLEATMEAVRLRFRPILMTSFAFILGVVPLAVAHGAGAASQQAIGTGVLFGMISATVLAVYLVPVFYVAVRSIVNRRKPMPADGPSPDSTPGPSDSDGDSQEAKRSWKDILGAWKRKKKKDDDNA